MPVFFPLFYTCYFYHIVHAGNPAASKHFPIVVTHSPTHSFGDAKRGGVWGELGTEWMLCREKKKINPQSAFSLHFFQEEASFLADVLILINFHLFTLC